MTVAPSGQVRADLKNIGENYLVVRALKLLTSLSSCNLCTYYEALRVDGKNRLKEL